MNEPLVIRRKRRINTGQRMHVPAWLADPDMPAPCICGQPRVPGQPTIMGEGETGMKRWFHVSCFQMMEGMDDDDDDWEDE